MIQSFLITFVCSDKFHRSLEWDSSEQNTHEFGHGQIESLDMQTIETCRKTNNEAPMKNIDLTIYT